MTDLSDSDLLIVQPVVLDGFVLDEAGFGRLATLLGVALGNDSAQLLLDHVRRLGGSYAVIEEPYTDQDYSSDFVTFYAAAFKHYPRRTKRVHFFDRDVGAIFGLPIAEQPEALCAAKTYLGFTVVRPIRQAPIGRTILRFPRLGNGLQVRFAARATFRVHLLGNELEIDGAPFIQQDARVGGCAQAAIWMACRPLHERYRRSGWHTVSDITRLAIHPTDPELSTALPHGSRGLSPIHIVRALRAMGHQPYCAIFVDEDGDQSDPQHMPDDEADDMISPAPDSLGDQTTSNPVEQAEWSEAEVAEVEDDISDRTAVPTIVRYLDSGLPVILGLANVKSARGDGHAVTAVGYVEVSDGVVRASESYDGFVRALIVHDDQRGPYRLMALTAEDVEYLPPEQLLCIQGRPIIAAEDVTHIFVPLSPRVVRLGDNADLIARNFIARIGTYGTNFAAAIRTLSDSALNTLQSFVDAAHEERLIRRTYLTTAGRYRHHLASTSLPEDVKVRAINRALPHFIWVTELIDPNAKQTGPDGERFIFGHIVVNATSAIDNNTDLLFAHLPHLDFQRDVDPADPEVDYIDHFTAVAVDAPYAQRIRRQR